MSSQVKWVIDSHRFVQSALLFSLALICLVPSGMLATEFFSVNIFFSILLYEIVLFPSLLLAAALIVYCIHDLGSFKQIWVVGIIFLLLGLLFSSIFTAQDAAAFRADGKYIFEGLAVLLVTISLGTKSFLRRLLIVVFSGAFGFMVISIFMYFANREFVFFLTGIERLVFYNQYLLIIVFPLLYYFFVRAPSIFNKSAILALFGLIVVATYLAISDSRALFVILILQFLYLLTSALGSRGLSSLLLAGLIGLVVTVSVRPFADTRDSRFDVFLGSEYMAEDVSFIARGEHVAVALDSLANHPFGVGLGSVLFVGYDPIQRTFVDHFHVDVGWLTIAAKFGVVGIVLLLLVFIYFVNQSRRIFSPEDFVLFKAIFIGFVALQFSASALTHSPMGIVFLALGGCILGVSANARCASRA